MISVKAVNTVRAALLGKNIKLLLRKSAKYIPTSKKFFLTWETVCGELKLCTQQKIEIFS